MTPKKYDTPWYKTNFPIQNLVFRTMPWTSIFYARRHYGFEWSWLIKTWFAAKGGKDRVFGGVQSKTENFFQQLAHRSSEEEVPYACVYGTCTVLWHPKRGNTGGIGRPGCPCDDMDDPRDLERGPLK